MHDTYLHPTVSRATRPSSLHMVFTQQVRHLPSSPGPPCALHPRATRHTGASDRHTVGSARARLRTARRWATYATRGRPRTSNRPTGSSAPAARFVAPCMRCSSGRSAASVAPEQCPTSHGIYRGAGGCPYVRYPRNDRNPSSCSTDPVVSGPRRGLPPPWSKPATKLSNCAPCAPSPLLPQPACSTASYAPPPTCSSPAVPTTQQHPIPRA